MQLQEPSMHPMLVDNTNWMHARTGTKRMVLVAGRSLNVAYLYGAYEDSKSVMLVMELCKGGELWKRVRSTRYSEKGASCPPCLALCIPRLLYLQ